MVLEGVMNRTGHRSPAGASPMREPCRLVVLEAFRITLERVPSARLLMVGKGPLETEAEGWIRTLRLHRSVSLLKGSDDIRQEMRKAWAFVLSSVREGSPNVILEAMASGLPVVAPWVGGIPELILHGRTGFLFDPKAPESLARHLIAILEDESFSRRMGARARRRVLDGFAMDRMILETERVLLEAVRDKEKRATALLPV